MSLVPSLIFRGLADVKSDKIRVGNLDNWISTHSRPKKESMRAPLQNRSHKISRTCSRSPLGIPACRMQGDAKREKPNGRKLSPSPNPPVERADASAVHWLIAPFKVEIRRHGPGEKHPSTKTIMEGP